MSLWGAVVITNLFSAIPLVGSSVVEWLWGGFSVGSMTLTRFYTFHYMISFLILGMIAAAHLSVLHTDGSTNPVGTTDEGDNLTFFPYYYVKDLLAFLIVLIFMLFLLVFLPNILGHADNYTRANPLVTPAHIVPE